MQVIRRASQAALLLDDTRRTLVERLVQGPDSATGLARKLGLPRQRVNYHLRTLEKDGLVELVEERKKGNCVERVVRATSRSFLISPEALGTLSEDPDAGHDRFSAAYLVGAAARMIRDVTRVSGRAREAGRRISTLTLEADVRFRNAADRQTFTEELAHFLSKLVAKHHDDVAPGGRRFHLVVGVYPGRPAEPGPLGS